MGIKPRGIDLTKSFTISGVKEIDDYTYVLLIDGGSDLTLIKRVRTDNSEIKYMQRPNGQSIENFWANPDATGMNYVWIHQV